MDLGARVVPEQRFKIAGHEGSESQAARDDRIARSKVHGAVSTRSIGGFEASSPYQFAHPVTPCLTPSCIGSTAPCWGGSQAEVGSGLDRGRSTRTPERAHGGTVSSRAQAGVQTRPSAASRPGAMCHRFAAFSVLRTDTAPRILTSKHQCSNTSASGAPSQNATLSTL